MQDYGSSIANSTDYNTDYMTMTPTTDDYGAAGLRAQQYDTTAALRQQFFKLIQHDCSTAAADF